MALTAVLMNGILTVSGEAARSNVGYVSIRDYAPMVQDNGEIPVNINVQTDGSYVKSIDARSITNIGTNIYVINYVKNIHGSNQSDYINAYGRHEPMKIFGLDGYDVIIGGQSSDQISGGSGNDRLSGSGGNDTLIGGRGDDRLDGGDGIDTAVYSGLKDDYSITMEDGLFIVTDLRARGDGIDYLGNIEFLQFSDGTVELDTNLTNIAAEISRKVLSISGDAARSNVNYVQINDFDPFVQDNGEIPVSVDVKSDGSIIKAIDARGLENIGAHIYAINYVQNVQGSNFGDYINTYGLDHSLTIRGNDGSDMIWSGQGSDKVFGGSGNERISTWKGNDTIVGGKGNDLIDGGEGIDTAVYSGSRENYSIAIEEGLFVVTDLRVKGDGVDKLGNVEFLKFADVTVDLTKPLADHHDELFF